MFNNKVLKKSDAAPYSMPSLEEDDIPHSKEDIIQSIEETQRQAYEEAFSSGEKAGFAQGEQKAAVLIERLEKILGEIINLQENLALQLEAQVVDLAVAIARKIIVEEIRTNPEIIVAMVREALKKLQRIGTITIKINPALHELFLKNKSELIDIHEDIVFDVNSNVSMTAPLVISEKEEVVTDIDALISNIAEDMKKVNTKKEKLTA